MLTYTYPSVTLDKVPQFLACKQRWIMVDPPHWAVTQIFLEVWHKAGFVRDIAVSLFSSFLIGESVAKMSQVGPHENGWNDVLSEIHDLSTRRKRKCVVCSWRLAEEFDLTIEVFFLVEQEESQMEGFDSRQCIVFGAQGEEDVWNKEALEVEFCCLGGRETQTVEVGGVGRYLCIT